MDTENIFITKSKFTELEKELEQLLIEGRTRIAEELDSAKAMGDLKENAEYHQAREDQAIMEERIGHIQHIIKHAQIIKGGKHSVVEMGATVTIARKGSSVKQEYQVVGSEESDAGAGKLSFDSPLVVGMIGKIEGDFFEFTTPDAVVLERKVIEVK